MATPTEKFWQFNQAINDLKSRQFEEEFERPIFRAGKLKAWLSFEFRLITNCYELSDRDKIHLVKHYCGPHLKELTRWIHTDDEESLSFNEFCRELLHRLDSVIATPEKLTFEFMKIKQAEDESSEDFVCKLMQYSHYMDFVGDDVENRLFLSAIIENAENSELRNYAIHYLHDKKYETFRSTDLKSKMIWKARFVDDMKHYLQRAEELKKETDSNNNNRPMSWKVCTKCGKHGHLTNVCWFA